MLVRRRAVAALAALAAFSLTACVEADNGNNTLADDKPHATDTAPGAAQSTAPARPQPGGPIDLEAKDNEFVPAKIEAAGGSVTINMRNTGQAPHNFLSEELKIDVDAMAGQDAEIKLKDVKAGTYKFVCKFHTTVQPPMVGELTIT